MHIYICIYIHIYIYCFAASGLVPGGRTQQTIKTHVNHTNTKQRKAQTSKQNKQTNIHIRQYSSKPSRLNGLRRFSY